MDEIRDALREGLREEAAPLSRRLAEVKGLSNNAIRKLDRLEGAIAAERSARVEDLDLLVDLLTESWRSFNTRLDRLESLLQEQRVEPQRAAEPQAAAPPQEVAAPRSPIEPGVQLVSASLYQLPRADTAG
jgi:hypothetical protein